MLSDRADCVSFLPAGLSSGIIESLLHKLHPVYELAARQIVKPSGNSKSHIVLKAANIKMITHKLTSVAKLLFVILVVWP